MRNVSPPLERIVRTETKDWCTPKVRNLLLALCEGRAQFIEQPIYLVQDQSRFYVYDGNTRVFLAENSIIPLNNLQLMETDQDLEEVRRIMEEVYWPGQNLRSVAGYLRSRSLSKHQPSQSQCSSSLG